MSVYFTYLVDELSEIEQTLADPALAPYAEGLRRAIGRALRLAAEARDGGTEGGDPFRRCAA